MAGGIRGSGGGVGPLVLIVAAAAFVAFFFGMYFQSARSGLAVGSSVADSSSPASSSSSPSPSSTGAREEMITDEGPRCNRMHPLPTRLPNVLRLAGYDCQKKEDLVMDRKGGAVIVEVGAYSGEETVVLAPHARKLYAFEPTPAKKAAIEARIAGQYRDRVELIMKAVGDYTGKVDLHLADGDNGAQQDSVGDQSFWMGEHKKISIDMVRLDDVVHEHVDLLKVDVQGHEMHVLRGAEGLIKNYGIDILHLEYSPNLLRSSGSDPAEFLYYLRDLGYLCMDCNAFQPPNMFEHRDFDSYGSNFGSMHYRQGDHGQWTDLLCYAS